MQPTQKEDADWSHFKSVIKELRGIVGLKVVLLSGAKMDNADILEVVDEFLPERSWIKDENVPLPKIIEQGSKFTRELMELRFLNFTLENIAQHVERGIVLVVRQEKLCHPEANT